MKPSRHLAQFLERALDVVGARRWVRNREHRLTGTEDCEEGELARTPFQAAVAIERFQAQRAHVGSLLTRLCDPHQPRPESVHAVATLFTAWRMSNPTGQSSTQRPQPTHMKRPCSSGNQANLCRTRSTVAGGLGRTRVVSGGLFRELGETAAVPRTAACAAEGAAGVVNVKAAAAGADVGAEAAAEAALAEHRPELAVEVLREHSRPLGRERLQADRLFDCATLLLDRRPVFLASRRPVRRRTVDESGAALGQRAPDPGTIERHELKVARLGSRRGTADRGAKAGGVRAGTGDRHESGALPPAPVELVEEKDVVEPRHPGGVAGAQADDHLFRHFRWPLERNLVTIEAVGKERLCRREEELLRRPARPSPWVEADLSRGGDLAEEHEPVLLDGRDDAAATREQRGEPRPQLLVAQAPVVHQTNSSWSEERKVVSGGAAVGSCSGR